MWVGAKTKRGEGERERGREGGRERERGREGGRERETETETEMHVHNLYKPACVTIHVYYILLCTYTCIFRQKGQAKNAPSCQISLLLSTTHALVLKSI